MSKKNSEERKNLESMSFKFHDSLFSKDFDDEAIVTILSNTTNLDRQYIRFYYKKKYGNSIQQDIKSQLNGDLKDLAIAMFDLPYEYDARELHRSLTSFTADDDTIIEIFVTRPRSHLILVQKIYKKFYNTTVRNDVMNLSNKDFSEFLIAILASDRPTEQTIKTEDAYNIAKDMVKNGIKQYGKNVNLFKQVFLKTSRQDLILISRAFNEYYKKNLYDTIDKEVSGRNKNLIKGLLFGVITPAQYFAKKAYKAMKGAGTDEDTLNRVIVSRAEIDMDDIREYYFRDWNTDLRNDIEGDTSGPYGQILMNLSEK